MNKKKLLIIVLLFSTVTLFASEAGEGSSMAHKMTNLVLQLAIIILFSKLFGYLFQRFLKQSKVLGELISGMVIGPFALGQIHLFGPEAVFPQFAGQALNISPELYGFAIVASIILLFLAGLETDLPTFIKFSGKGSIVGIGGVLISFLLGNLTAVLFIEGVSTFMHPTALFLGTLSTATSVGITARILSEKRKMSSPEGVTILAAAVLDDVIGIVILAIVVGIASISGTGGGSVNWGEIGIIALKAFGFWLICTVVGILVAPKLTKGLKRFKSMELIASISLGLALLLAGLSEKAGLAMIIGAYVTGLSLSQTDISHEIMKRTKGIYDFFVPIFFCVMGMMVDFAQLASVWDVGLIYTGMAMLGKIVGCGVPALFAGFNLRGAFRIGAGMLPRGEVTLIIAGIGLSQGIIGSDIFGVAIMTMLVASVVAPPVIVASFKGGPGYKSKIKKGKDEPVKSIELSFPSSRIADFITEQILHGFRNEEFFVHHMDRSKPIYHIRKDEIHITFVQKDTTITLNTAPENEQFVRLLMLEGLLELNDMLSGLKSMKSPDMMGADLLIGMFAAAEPEKNKDD